jgi:hypothetical protein
MPVLNVAAAVEKTVRKAVADVTVTDVHTHLFPPSHGRLLQWGVDELLTYHYLVAELFTVAPAEVTPERFWRLTTAQQADLIWEHLFLRHGPLSEATRGVLTTLTALGLDVRKRDLTAARKWFAAQRVEEYLPHVFRLAKIDSAVMTNNPFLPEEAEWWQRDAPALECLRAALRIDTLILDWPSASAAMRAAGYRTPAKPTVAGCAAARRFLADWAAVMDPVYLAASLPPDFAYPSSSLSTRVLNEVVLPTAADLHLPLALMIGVRKQVNPALRAGGDGLGVADMLAVQRLCQANPRVKFLVTVLSRVNQHEVTVLARKFRNLHVFGCWWFLNNPSIIAEMTRMRLELLGTAFTCQHSDARVLDQLIYKWAHTRAVVADVLVEKYRAQFAAGWRPTADDIRRDVRSLFGGAFEEFRAR